MNKKRVRELVCGVIRALLFIMLQHLKGKEELSLYI